MEIVRSEVAETCWASTLARLEQEIFGCCCCACAPIGLPHPRQALAAV